MISKKLLLVLIAASFLSSCKKNYICECTNSNGSYEAGEITDTKRKAKKQCDKLSSESTTCALK
jgi:hypothetical protein